MKTATRYMGAIHRSLFVRKQFYNLNKLLFRLSLHGLGMLNYQNDDTLSDEEHFLKHCLANKGQVLVLDVGANEGRYSNKVKELRPDAEVFAFEPHPKTFERLEQEANTHGYASFNVACSEKSGQAELFDYGHLSEGSQYATLHVDVIEKLRNVTSSAWQVSVITIDQFVEENRIGRVHLLKIDTEGNELNVLRGAKRSIDRGIIDIIQFEFNEMNVISRVFFKDFYDILPKYSFYRMLPNGLVPLGSYTPFMCEIFAFQNIIAVREE